jgi:thiol-disulfide isomerase/thioredoxin
MMRAFWRRRRKSHRVQFFTKEGCTLCRGVRATLEELRPEYDLSIEEIDITIEPAIFERYKNVIPVVIVDDRATLAGWISEQDLRGALR